MREGGVLRKQQKGFRHFFAPNKGKQATHTDCKSTLNLPQIRLNVKWGVFYSLSQYFWSHVFLPLFQCLLASFFRRHKFSRSEKQNSLTTQITWIVTHTHTHTLKFFSFHSSLVQPYECKIRIWSKLKQMGREGMGVKRSPDKEGVVRKNHTVTSVLQKFQWFEWRTETDAIPEKS